MHAYGWGASWIQATPQTPSSLFPCGRNPRIQLQHSCLRDYQAKITSLENYPLQPLAEKNTLFPHFWVFLLPTRTPLSLQTIPESLCDSQNLRIKECDELHPASFTCAALLCQPLPRAFWCVSGFSQTRLLFSLLITSGLNAWALGPSLSMQQIWLAEFHCPGPQIKGRSRVCRDVKSQVDFKVALLPSWWIGSSNPGFWNPSPCLVKPNPFHRKWKRKSSQQQLCFLSQHWPFKPWWERWASSFFQQWAGQFG